MALKESKFKYGDKVKIVKGFYRGRIGKVTDYKPDFPNPYWVYHGNIYYKEDELELFIPWYKRLFTHTCDGSCYY